MVLSETCARWRGLSLVLVIRGGLWSVEYLGELPARRTLLLRLPLEPSARIEFEHRDGRPVLSVVFAERYVVCNVSFFESQRFPFFQRCSAIAAIFRASVTLAKSSLVPRATHAS